MEAAMNAKTIFKAEELLEIARTLTPLQRQLLVSLLDKGPGLLLELAVRIFKFPDEINQPVKELLERGLIETASYAGGQLGGELLSLSEEGRQMAILLKDPTVVKELQEAQAKTLSAPAAAADPRQQELEIVQKLAKLAEQRGDLAEASKWYQQALDITRTLAVPPSATSR
jgi:hypothetical protein